MKIRLTNEIIFKLQHPNYAKVKKGLTEVLNLDRTSIVRLLKENQVNGHLTKLAVIEYLETELNVARHQLIEIIED